MTTLDRNRPYGTIYGSHMGASFTQDDNLFNGAGELIGEPKPAPKAAPAPKAEKPAKAAKEPEEAPVAPEPKASDDGPSGPAIPLTADEKVDLKGWAAGKVKVPWHILSNAVMAHYSERPRNSEHAREIILAE